LFHLNWGGRWGYVPLKAFQSDNTDLATVEQKTGEVSREAIPPLPLPLNSNWNVKSLIKCSNSWMQDPGPRILDAGSWIQSPGSRVWNLGSRILDPQSRIQDGEPRILDTGLTQGPASTTLDQGFERFVLVSCFIFIEGR